MEASPAVTRPSAMARGMSAERSTPEASKAELQPAEQLYSNPHGCWDFFAYDDPDYATHEGRQVAAVKRMLDRLRSPAPR